jgi:very-short-patch-repair endonuclease
LEIDGKQHKYRKEHDDERDKLLNEYGYIVYRIKWKNINTEMGKEYIKNEIDKFMEFYDNN